MDVGADVGALAEDEIARLLLSVDLVALARMTSSVDCHAIGTAFSHTRWGGSSVVKLAVAGTPVGALVPIQTLSSVVVAVLSQ